MALGLGTEHGCRIAADDNYRQSVSLSGYLQIIYVFCQDARPETLHQRDQRKISQERRCFEKAAGNDGTLQQIRSKPYGRLLAYADPMPVFMALFFFVPNAIELRQQSFLWAPDLSTYDDIINWGTNIPLLGNHLSLFCLLFSITNILNTMYTMKQQDMGQQQMPGMKLMMYIMPVMFIFIFNGYSSGLNYYYFISGLIGILTMVILRKTTDEKKLLAMLEARKEKKSQKNGGKPGGGLMAKLEALQKEQERLQQEKNEIKGKNNEFTLP